MTLPPEAAAVVESAALAHLVTLDQDGSPYVTIAWAGLEDGEIVIGTLADQRKLRNMRRDPRVVVSFETDVVQPPGLHQHLIVYGRARVTEGGGAALLSRLARTYLGPDVRFPPMDDPPDGYVTRIAVERVAGVGPWAP